MLGLSTVAALALAPWLDPWTVSATNVVVSFAVQAVKISIDSLLQAHVPDALLGRTFALQDMMYNSGLVAAASLAAFTLPPGGATNVTFFAVAAVLGTLALVLPTMWRRVSARDGRATVAGGDPASPEARPAGH